MATRTVRERLRQRFIELVAFELLGATPALVAGWRTSGQVPHAWRLDLIEKAREVGLELAAPADFINWRRLHVR